MVSFDVPGAFLQADLPGDKLLLLRLTGDFVDIMCDINPEHRKNVITDKKGRKILYMKVLRALYGCIEAALAWYNMFTTTLMKEGFKLNPYDKCVANKTINGKQCTIAWHVDDCVATHIEQSVLDALGALMIKHFGDMKIHTGKEHEFLGMKLIITDDRKLKIDMRRHIQEMLDDFEKENDIILKESVTSPATDKLFQSYGAVSNFW